MNRWLNAFTALFPVWVSIGGVWALFQPEWFTWFLPYVVPGLAVIMLGMGITLSLEDFHGVLRMPKAVGAGVSAQFIIMPLLGWSVARLFNLPVNLAVGLILVSCCPGGTASNVVAYLARAHVALSVLMTMCSTFAAVLLTPWLTKLYAGTLVPVDAWKLFLDTVKVVLLPVLSGLALHHLFPKSLKYVLPVAPPIAVIAIVLICAAIIGKDANLIRESGGVLVLAVALLHFGGFGLGYFSARLLGYDILIRRTVSIEVGMQNSGLGAVLARNNFDPATAVPSAISSVFHSVIGSALAGWWRMKSMDKNASETQLDASSSVASSVSERPMP